MGLSELVVANDYIGDAAQYQPRLCIKHTILSTESHLLNMTGTCNYISK